MAKLWIREYLSIAQVIGVGNDLASDEAMAQIVREPGIDQAPVTFSASVASLAFATKTRLIAISSDVDFHYVIGDTPVATTNALPVAAKTLLYLGVKPGQKIAAIVAA